MPEKKKHLSQKNSRRPASDLVLPSASVQVHALPFGGWGVGVGWSLVANLRSTRYNQILYDAMNHEFRSILGQLHHQQKEYLQFANKNTLVPTTKQINRPSTKVFRSN